MQQHTGQHLLSAMFQERFGLSTVSFHLGSEICTIDLRGPEPAEEILEGAERAANQVVFEDRPVNVRYGTADQLSQLGVRKEVERDGILRAIEIESADLQPCGGPPVKRAGQMGFVLLRRCTKVRQDWRVEFVCGRRSERFARHDFQVLRQTAEKLRCAPGDEVFGSAPQFLGGLAQYLEIMTREPFRTASADKFNTPILADFGAAAQQYETHLAGSLDRRAAA